MVIYINTRISISPVKSNYNSIKQLYKLPCFSSDCVSFTFPLLVPFFSQCMYRNIVAATGWVCLYWSLFDWHSARHKLNQLPQFGIWQMTRRWETNNPTSPFPWPTHSPSPPTPVWAKSKMKWEMWQCRQLMICYSYLV